MRVKTDQHHHPPSFMTPRICLSVPDRGITTRLQQNSNKTAKQKLFIISLVTLSTSASWAGPACSGGSRSDRASSWSGLGFSTSSARSREAPATSQPQGLPASASWQNARHRLHLHRRIQRGVSSCWGFRGESGEPCSPCRCPGNYQECCSGRCLGGLVARWLGQETIQNP